MKSTIQLSDHFNYWRLLRFTLPAMGMMLCTSVYSIVDGYFVSNFAGKTPFAAINLIMPFLMILSTVGFMMGTGGSAIVAKTFGEGDKERANRYFSLFVYTTVALGVFFSALGIVFARPLAMRLGAEGELLRNAVLYARIILFALPFNVLQFLFQSFYVTAERPQLGLWVTIASGLTNVVLDAVLVILLPQEYKLAGAAVATALSQLVGGLAPVLYFARRDNGSILRIGRAHFDCVAIFKACTNGSSEFMTNISMSLVGMLYNIQLMRHAGEDGLAAYGVMMYVSMIFCSIFVGYTVGVAPVVGYHDGARNHAELRGLLRKSVRLIGSFGLAMTLSAELLARPLAMIFVSYDAELLAMTVSGFRVFSLAFFFTGFAIFSSGFFTALNDGVTSAIISFLRTLVCEAAAILVLPALMGLRGIWLSFVTAEVMAVVFALFFLVVKRKRYHY